MKYLHFIFLSFVFTADPLFGVEQFESRDDFIAQYKSGVQRLKSVLDSVQGTARTKKLTNGAMSSWSEMEFYASKGKVRLHELRRHVGASQVEELIQSVLLWTPDHAAIVMEPNTQQAWLESVSKSERSRVEAAKHVRFDRYLAAAFSSSDLDYSALFEDGSFKIKSIQPSDSNPDWVEVNVEFSQEAAGLPVSQLQFNFSPKEDWAAREVIAQTQGVSDFRVTLTISMKKIPDLGFVVNRFEMKSFSGGKLDEHEIFELISCEPCSLDGSDFTLQALGITPKIGSWGRRSTVLLVAASLFLFVFVLRIKFSSSVKRN